MNGPGSMNRVFRVVWNASLGVWQVAAEITRSRGKTKSTRAGHALRSVWAAVAAGSLLLLGLPGQAADLPTGADIKSGVGAIASDGTRMTVSQETQKMVVDWQSFSIGQGKQVHFEQPSASAAVLNRVLGSQVSVIRGAMTSTGRVFLVNPSGVMFTKDAQVDVGALVASTLQISDADFLSGNYRFSGSSTASVVNEGRIRSKDGGFVALIAAKVENLGSIDATRGDVLLGAGSRVRLNMGGPVSLEIEAAAVDALVRNGGAIRADGGTVLLTAEAAGSLTSLAINNQGLIEAVGLESGPGGSIRLAGGSGPTVNSGAISARSAGGQGGRVEITGARVELRDGSTVDASGATGGGTVLVGGDFQGKNADVPNALQTLVESGARIAADATDSGSGGRVIVWADDRTDYHGSISAKGAGTPAALAELPQTVAEANAEPVNEVTAAPAVGGANLTGDSGSTAGEQSGLSGTTDPAGLPAHQAPLAPSSGPVATSLVNTGRRDGGFAEVSGKGRLVFDGHVDLTTSASEGQSGTLLLDPKNITVTTNGAAVGGDVSFGTDPSADSTISADSITAITNAGTSIVLQANNDITISAAIITERNGGVSRGGDLTFTAGKTFTNNTTITTDSGNLTITANASEAAGVVAAHRDSEAAHLRNDGVINAGTGNVSLTLAAGDGRESGGIRTGVVNAATLTVSHQGGTAAGNIDLGSNSVQNMTVTASQARNLTNNNGVVSVQGTSSSTTTIDVKGGNVSLTNTNNDFEIVRVTSANNVSINDLNGIRFGASTIAGDFSLTTRGPMANFSTASGERLTVGGQTTLTAQQGSFGTTPPTIEFNNSSNDFNSVRVVTGATTTIYDSNGFSLGGGATVTTGPLTLNAASGNIAINSNVTTTGNFVASTNTSVAGGGITVADGVSLLVNQLDGGNGSLTLREGLHNTCGCVS